MTIFRMFCALHTPAEEHQCNFDYQVSKLKVSLWWWSIWLYGVDDTEWFNPQWFWRNEKTVISIQRPRPGSRLKRRTPRWGVDNISFIFFWNFLHATYHTQSNQITRWSPRKWRSCECGDLGSFWRQLSPLWPFFETCYALETSLPVLSDFCIWYPLMCNKLNTTMPNCTPDVHCTTDIYAWVLSYVPHHCQDMCRWCEICSALMTHGCGCSNIC